MSQMSKEQLHDTIRNDILNLTLKPGSGVSEIELANRYQVSRTPIREILIHLRQEKLVHVYPQKGTIIALIDMKYLKQMVHMRLLIEKEVLVEASQQLDAKGLQELRMLCSLQRVVAEHDGDPIEFLRQDNAIHQSIFASCGHQEIWAVLEKSSVHYRRFRLLDVFEKKQMLRLVDDHEKLVDLLAARDTASMAEFIHKHLFAGLSHSDEVIARHPGYFLG